MFRHLLGFSIGVFQAAPARPTLPDIIRDRGTARADELGLGLTV
jgi:hypothetical protein